jgi:hypothetical protein
MSFKTCAKARLSEVRAWSVAKRFRKGGDDVHAYHCTDCGGWHVGFHRQSDQQRRSHA